MNINHRIRPRNRGSRSFVRRLQGGRWLQLLPRSQNHVHVIIGPNGAGKTTVLDLICGKTLATSGSIKFKGKELRGVQGIPDRPRRHRPEIPDPVDLRKPHRLREPRTLPSHRPRRLRLPDVPPHAGDPEAVRGRRRTDRPHGQARHRSRHPQPRPEAVAGDRHAPHAGARRSSCSTNRSPA